MPDLEARVRPRRAGARQRAASAEADTAAVPKRKRVVRHDRAAQHERAAALGADRAAGALPAGATGSRLASLDRRHGGADDAALTRCFRDGRRRLRAGVAASGARLTTAESRSRVAGSGAPKALGACSRCSATRRSADCGCRTASGSSSTKTPSSDARPRCPRAAAIAILAAPLRSALPAAPAVRAIADHGRAVTLFFPFAGGRPEVCR